MKNSNELSSLLSGVAGEYYVAAELSKRGHLASITLRNTKGVDILCSNEDASKTVAIQVKTNRRSSREWILNNKAEKDSSDNFFYVFVNLNDNVNSPDYFIVPSKFVSEFVTRSHQDWLDKPGAKGQKHNDSTMRKFADKGEVYLNKWEILDL